MKYERMWYELKKYIKMEIYTLKQRREDCNARKEKILHKIQYRYEKILEIMNKLEEEE